jgi:cytochrome d ubiquinol oxidase subunit II
LRQASANPAPWSTEAAMAVESLNTVWFCLIGLLWAGYFVLEGFDFGVGILSRIVGRSDLERRVCINAIGPFWDGNEVWLLVAGGATFAAFPQWYATMFSGFYLALFLILAGLIVRGVSFEFRAKDKAPAWRNAWDWALFAGSLVPSLLWGVAFVDMVHGLDIGPGDRYLGGFGGLLSPVSVVGGIFSLLLLVFHGSAFLAAKVEGGLSSRIRVVSLTTGPAVVLVGSGLVTWLALDGLGRPSPASLPHQVPLALGAAALLILAWASVSVWQRRPLCAFFSSTVAVLLLVAAEFTALFPRVMVSTHPAWSLDIWNSASAHETLLVMTVVAAIFTPFVLAYQGWSYWVFRQRLRVPGSGAGARAGEAYSSDRSRGLSIQDGHSAS